MILECKAGDVVSMDRSKSSGYYSAYLSIMFVIQDAADAATYHVLKEQLVAKACPGPTGMAPFSFRISVTTSLRPVSLHGNAGYCPRVARDRSG